MTTNNNKKILVDIIVADCMIRALKPEDQSPPMSTSTEDKILFWNTIHADKLNHRLSGQLKGEALVQAAAAAVIVVFYCRKNEGSYHEI